jgi:hypothetical protein
MNGAAVLTAGALGNVPTTWSVALVGDYNGDGMSDLLWRDNSGNTSIWFMNGVTVPTTGAVGNIPTNWTVQSVNADDVRESPVDASGGRFGSDERRPATRACTPVSRPPGLALRPERASNVASHRARPVIAVTESSLPRQSTSKIILCASEAE